MVKGKSLYTIVHEACKEFGNTWCVEEEEEARSCGLRAQVTVGE